MIARHRFVLRMITASLATATAGGCFLVGYYSGHVQGLRDTQLDPMVIVIQSSEPSETNPITEVQ